MSVIRSITRSVTRSIISSVIRTDSITRFFTQTETAASKYYTIPIATASGDFILKFKVYIPNAPANSVLLSGTSTEERVARVNAGGQIRAYAGGAFVNTTTVVKDSKIYEIEYERSGTIITLKVGGVLEGSNDNVLTAGDVTITDFMRRASGSDYSEGIIFDVECVSGWDSSRFYPIDEDLSTTSTIIDTISGQNGTAVNIIFSPFYTLNAAGTIWTSPTGPDLEIA